MLPGKGDVAGEGDAMGEYCLGVCRPASEALPALARPLPADATVIVGPIPPPTPPPARLLILSLSLSLSLSFSADMRDTAADRALPSAPPDTAEEGGLGVWAGEMRAGEWGMGVWAAAWPFLAW